MKGADFLLDVSKHDEEGSDERSGKACCTGSRPSPSAAHTATAGIKRSFIATSKIAVTFDNCGKKWYNMSQGDERNG